MKSNVTEIERAIFAVSFLAERGGVPLTEPDRQLLASTVRSSLLWSGGVYVGSSGAWKYSEVATCADLNASEIERLGEILTSCFHGFWVAAADGAALTDEAELVEWQGAPIAQAYPGAGGPFLQFARTYWTLNTVWRSLLSSNHVVTRLLARLCTYIGDVFFPAIPPASRDKWASDQRRLIASFSSGIDPDAFVESNPLLSTKATVSLWPFGKEAPYSTGLTMACRGWKRGHTFESASGFRSSRFHP